MKKKLKPGQKLMLSDLQGQYEAFCENVKAVKQNTYWKTSFNKIRKGNQDEEKNKKA